MIKCEERTQHDEYKRKELQATFPRLDFCGEDVEGSTQSEEALSSSKSRGRTLDLLKKAYIMRYDVALGINTLGPLLLLNFVKKCNNVKVFHVAINTVLFQKPHKDKYTALDRKLKRGMRLAKLYEPYVFFKGIFDDTNSEKLQIAARETCSEADAFNFDPTSVNWEAYMMDVHFLRSTTSEIIYHVGSSLRNPFKFSNFQELGIRYFVQNPLIDKDGKPIKVGEVTAFSSMASFRIYMAIRYSLPLKVFHLSINTVLFQKPYKDKYTALHRKFKRGMLLAKLYEPYVFFKGIFDDTNSEKLQIAARETCSEADTFNFDPTSVNWEAYMMDVHFSLIFFWLND
ncbi:hypothetical protein POTOM_059338 [Populus tomentosa]|uniref:Fatty acyl-CoA reductase C-terminal domain-containing protein n=1 Tax=Populus tomentosa TaxID=118781 RepID=A0A8X7XWT5_POPTO|nr:hypothetical protein POTOM_059338 [Populus tomentosa]